MVRYQLEVPGAMIKPSNEADIVLIVYLFLLVCTVLLDTLMAHPV